MDCKEIKRELYERYCQNNSFSSVTSSHWRQYGRMTKIEMIGDKLEIDTFGVSEFNKATVFSFIKHVPRAILIRRLLRKHRARKKTIGAARRIVEKLGILFEFDHAKHVLIYDLIDSYNLFDCDNYVCVIGDGHGFFGTLIRELRPDVKLVFVNLGRNLFLDVHRFDQYFPNVVDVSLLGKDREVHTNVDTIFLVAEHIEQLDSLAIDLWVNVASMQEMNIQTINKYFEFISSSKTSSYFYCCNREEKTLPDGSVVRFADYPWKNCEIIFDELSPWYQRFPISKPPFWRSFDGPHRHRLVSYGSKEIT